MPCKEGPCSPPGLQRAGLFSMNSKMGRSFYIACLVLSKKSTDLIYSHHMIDLRERHSGTGHGIDHAFARLLHDGNAAFVL